MKRVLMARTFCSWLPIDEMERGLVDADLGGNVYKRRVAFER